MSETLASEAWVGPFRTPRNMAAEVKGSIHDDSTAQKLGFRGGTVAGSVHMDQFVPRLVEVYGETWFETGGLSLYFTQATVDREEVRAVVDTGPERSRLTMFNHDDAQILVGTASGGPDAEAELAGRMAGQAAVEAGRLRILADVKVGDEARDIPVRLEPETLENHLEIITETVPAYAKGVLPPSQAVRPGPHDPRQGDGEGDTAARGPVRRPGGAAPEGAADGRRRLCGAHEDPEVDREPEDREHLARGGLLGGRRRHRPRALLPALPEGLLAPLELRVIRHALLALAAAGRRDERRGRDAGARPA
jgi:hypothetical protein